MTLSDIADEIFLELGEPTDTTSTAIQFWLQTNVGQLNNLIDAEFATATDEILPDLTSQQRVLFKLLYFIYYYTRQVNKNLGAAAYVSFSEVREGNRTVKRVNKNDVAKTYLGVVADYRAQLYDQLQLYKMNASDPLMIVVPNPILDEQGYLVDSIRNPRADIL